MINYTLTIRCVRNKPVLKDITIVENHAIADVDIATKL